jgi:hypothetical protein
MNIRGERREKISGEKEKRKQPESVNGPGCYGRMPVTLFL